MDSNEMMITEKFGKRLKEILTENELTQKWLADFLGLNYFTVNKYINGARDPQLAHIRVIAQQFNISPYWLMGVSDDKYNNKYQESKKVPVLGHIAAGVPITAEENIDGYEYVKAGDKVDFCLVVKGDSMINARIYHNDIVFIKKQPDVEEGEIAAVLIGNEATLKRVYHADHKLILKPENLKYKDIIVNKASEEVRILGKAMFFKSKVK